VRHVDLVANGGKGPVVSLDISGVSGSAKLFQKRSFLEHAENTPIDAAKNPVQNPTSY
jgi:hypothetical protein